MVPVAESSGLACRSARMQCRVLSPASFHRAREKGRLSGWLERGRGTQNGTRGGLPFHNTLLPF